MTALRRGGAIGIVVILVVLGLIAWGAYSLASRGGGYKVNFVFPAATNLNTGGLVEVQGYKVGNVTHLSVTPDGQALVEVTISGQNNPLHSGTSAAIDYKSLLGERYLEITPGPKANPVLASGAIISNGKDGNTVQPRVEIQTLVNQLDQGTRNQLADLIPQFKDIFAGANTQNTQATLQTAEPTIQALAQLLKAVGSDGQALHSLIANMGDLSTRLVNRQQSLVNTVQGLDQSMGAVAQETSNLAAGINQLPATLDQANTTLAMVPSAASATVPLLNDLKTATDQLPTFSRELQPVLTELQPVSAELVPTLNGLSNLLQYTPALVSNINTVVPQAQKAVSGLTPALQYLRPYSPEIAGTFYNWGDWLASYNRNGHRVPVPATFGVNSFEGSFSNLTSLLQSNLNLSSLSGLTINANRQPGQLPGGDYQGQDAAGNPVQ